MSKLPTKISLKLDPEKYPGDSLEEKGAAIAVDPSMKAALTAHLFTTNLGKIDLPQSQLMISDNYYHGSDGCSIIQ